MYPPIETELGTTHVVINLTFNKPLLRTGVRKAEVREIRKLLEHWNVCPCVDSDVFDTSLEKSVKAFQRRVFLADDGIVGPLTWQALYVGAPVNMPELKRGYSGEAVKQLQKALQMAGIRQLKVSGCFDTVTESAVRDFQRRKGLVVDGVVGTLTWRVLSKTPHLE